MSKKYEIGYAKPPEESQFKKGKSGNPNGRPKGSKNTYKLLTEVLEQEITVKENGQNIKISKKAAMLMQLVNKSVKGDLKAITSLLPHMITAEIKEEEKERFVASLTRDDKAIIDSYIAGLNKEIV